MNREHEASTSDDARWGASATTAGPRLRGLLIGSLLCAALACDRPAPSTSAPPASPPPPATKPNLPVPQVGPPLLDYVEMVTAGGQVDQALPIIVAVHGLGDRPEHFLRWIQRLPFAARVIAPRGPSAHDRGFSWFPATRPFDAPPPDTLAGIRESTDRLATLLDHLARAHPSPRKPIITGFSQGGILSFAVAVRYPDAIAAALPISGTWSAPPGDNTTGRTAPIYAFHGEADEVIPVGLAEAAMTALSARGPLVSLQRYPGVRHTISRQMRRDIFERLDALTR